MPRKKPKPGTPDWYAQEVTALRQELREALARERAAKLKRKAVESDLELSLLGMEHAVKKAS